MGSYRCFGFNENSREVFLLYSGYNHYDSLVDWPIGDDRLDTCSADFSSSNLGREIFAFNTSVPMRRVNRESCKQTMFPLRTSRKRVSSLIAVFDTDDMSAISFPRFLSRCIPNFGESKDKSGHMDNSRNVTFLLTDNSKRNNRRLRIEKRCATRRKTLIVGRRTSCAVDASLYSKIFDIFTQFIVCGICGVEGPSRGSKLISDMQLAIDMSGLKTKFTSLTAVTSYSSKYDVIFIDEILGANKDGLIIGCTHLCLCCCQQLKGRSKRSVTSKDVNVSTSAVSDVGAGHGTVVCVNVEAAEFEEHYQGAIVESDVEYSVNTISGGLLQSHRYPYNALFNGLFAGTVPVESVGLIGVEESMISIYSSVTKMFLAGGKHYKMKGGTSYTIVNDLSSVAKSLPRMPSIEDTAVMRHRKTVVGKEYTYRPFRVFSALNWLKEHNHLYTDIELIWPISVMYWKITTIPVDIPFIELTDDETCDIDSNSVEDDEVSDEYTTNSGKSILLIYFVVT